MDSQLAVSSTKKYCESLTQYKRRPTREVMVGSVGIGGHNPIRLQSMTTVDTMDTQGSIEQSIRMIEAGCELVRITAPSLKEAQNLENIKKGLRERGYDTPLVADIHFTPNAAELAAKIVEKVRVNPGNYADKKKFEEIEYTDDSYQAELDRIREKFTPLVNICKEHGTAMRIGTNHGSLSDRIMSRYGDTPMGMVESALEFLRICEDLNYYDIVISMKSSNPQVMVQAYRLLVNRLDAEGLQPYPLHLGVTEAGEAEDGRIKSAVGIGTLLEDGLGDTVRVSLTEEPEAEIPVADVLVKKVGNRGNHKPILAGAEGQVDPFEYRKRKSKEVSNIGGENVPRVLADLSKSEIKEMKDLKSVGHFYLPELDKWSMNDFGVDYVYSGSKAIPFMLPNGLKEVLDFDVWSFVEDKLNKIPLFTLNQIDSVSQFHQNLNFLRLKTDEIDHIPALVANGSWVLILRSDNTHAMADMRSALTKLMEREVETPVIFQRDYLPMSDDELMIYSSTDFGGLLIDGLGDGLMIGASEHERLMSNELKKFNEACFGILQASRTRITKTEYISCPSCGRTLFDLQETTAMIRKRTDHLKGVKIGIMGCIVNGPGEMADADYGYVGSGKGKITLYKGKEVVKRAVPSEHALDELIELIKDDGAWVEPEVALS